MKLTREQIGRIALAVLGAGALYGVYSSFFAGPPGAPADTAVRGSSVPAATTPASTELAAAKRAAANRGRGDEFHPVWRPKRVEDRVDPLKIDPTLMTDLLAKVTAVEASGGSRNLFAFSQPPPKVVELAGKEPTVRPRHYGPDPVPAPPVPQPTVEPAPPPLTLKFYGFSTVRHNGKKSAYFLDGDDILIAAEGETLKKRYKLVRISAGSVLLEDTESKRQQSVPLTQEAPSS